MIDMVSSPCSKRGDGICSAAADAYLYAACIKLTALPGTDNCRLRPFR
jgi:hypothetical protein